MPSLAKSPGLAIPPSFLSRSNTRTRELDELVDASVNAAVGDIILSLAMVSEFVCVWYCR